MNAFSPDTIKDAPASFEIVDSKVPDLKEKVLNLRCKFQQMIAPVAESV